MIVNNNQRFKDAVWVPKEPQQVMIGGSGGIGSWLTFFLSRMGFIIYLYDFDTIEEHNLGGQLFKQEDVGTRKVDAVARIAREYNGAEITTFCEEVNKFSNYHHYSFSAFDNMKARKILFENWKKSWARAYQLGITPIFIDGRLELETFQIFCVLPKDADKYEASLFLDASVEEAPCTLKQSSHTAAMIGSTMSLFFTNHITNVVTGENMRDVPFYYEFVGPMAMTILKL